MPTLRHCHDSKVHNTSANQTQPAPKFRLARKALTIVIIYLNLCACFQTLPELNQQAVVTPVHSPHSLSPELKSAPEQTVSEKKTEPEQEILKTLKARRLHSKALWLRDDIAFYQWRVDQSPLNVLAKIRLAQRQSQARLLLQSILDALKTEQFTQQSHVLALYMPVLITLTPDTFLKYSPAGDSAPTSSPAGLNKIINTPELAQSLEAALHPYTVQSQSKTLSHPTNRKGLNASLSHEPTGLPPSEPKVVFNTAQLEAAMNEGDLAQLQHLLNQIKPDQTLALSQQIQISALRAYLQQQIVLLNEQADNYYQQGFLEEAQGLWKKLLTLTPEDAQLTAKIIRVQTVLQNMEQLRQGQNENTIDTSSSKLKPPLPK